MSYYLGPLGSSSDHDREDLQGRLRLAETRAEELTESLRTVTSSMEQYKAMAQSLEESLDKEKQVQKNPFKLFELPSWKSCHDLKVKHLRFVGGTFGWI